jgi:RimJ/RimL family protein N-acetyltransferase
MILRLMTMADADFMLMLKNYPETREFAIATHDEVSKEAHYKWLPDNLQYFRIIEDNEGKSMGAFRVQEKEVSIWIAREYWKQGIATFVLQRHTDKSMFCKIVAGNIASLRCFIRAGFLPKSFQNGYYIFQK